MKITKNVLTAFSFVVLMAFANESFANSNPENWKSEIMTHLKGIQSLDLEDAPDRILVDFILNEKGEIMVLSTSYPQLDDLLKSRLNYKKIGFEELKVLEKYTLPILLEKV